MNRLKEKLLAPPDPGYAAAGDFVRVACVLLIGWYHIWQQSWLSPVLTLGRFRLDMTPCVRTGYLAVDIMLALSGFLTYLPYANDREAPANQFYLKRALRILPSYLLCLAVMLAQAVTRPDFSDAPRLMKDLLAHLGFVHNLFPFSYNASRLNVVLWTLAVEVQFYLILPVLAPAFRKRPLVAYAAMTVAGMSFMFIWTAPMADTTLFVNRLPNMLVVYANGMLAAHIYARAARLERRALVATLGLMLFIAAGWGVLRIAREQSYVSGYDNIRLGQLRWRWLYSLCGSAMLLGGSVTFAPLRALMSNRFTRFLSGVSFNFYIWHQVVSVKLKQWRIPPYAATENPNMAGEMPWQLHYTLLCFAVALVVAVAATYLVEQPCARWGRRRLEEKYGGKA